MDRMSKSDRTELTKVVRMRARVAKDGAAERSAVLMADFERKLAAEYKSDASTWRDLTEAANKAVEEADAELAERCRSLGIPAEFRPKIAASWYSRGENAEKDRRAELRRVAQTQIAVMEKAAKVSIDRHAADLVTTLIAGGLESSEAVAFLACIPTVDELMPALSLEEIKALGSGGGSDDDVDDEYDDEP
jgi:hypothetical protein